MRLLSSIALTTTLICASAQAATVTALGVVVSTFISEETPSEEEFTYNENSLTNPALPSNPFQSQRVADFGGNATNGLVTGRANDLTYGEPEGTGTISYTGTDILSASVTEAIGTVGDVKQKIDIGAFAQYTIEFELGVGETKIANLDMTYRIALDNDQSNSAVVSWELLGPGMNRINDFSFTDTRSHNPLAPPPANTPVDEIVDVNSTVTLTEAGTYTFTIFTQIPDQDFNNGKKSAIAEVTDFYAEVVNIPEPSSSSLLLLGSASFLLRRKR
jgi:hypothetical protein